MIRALIITFVLLTNWAAASDWPAVPYSYVKLFEYNLETTLRGEYEPVKQGLPDATAVGRYVDLNAKQADEIIKWMEDETSVLQAGLSKCFEPHHAVVFYNERHEVVAWCSVCFLCQKVIFWPAKERNEIRKMSMRKVQKAEKQLNELQAMFATHGFEFQDNIPGYKAYHKTLVNNANEVTIQVPDNKSWLEQITGSFLLEDLSAFENEPIYDLTKAEMHAENGEEMDRWIIEDKGCTFQFHGAGPYELKLVKCREGKETGKGELLGIPINELIDWKEQESQNGKIHVNHPELHYNATVYVRAGVVVGLEAIVH